MEIFEVLRNYVPEWHRRRLWIKLGLAAVWETFDGLFLRVPIMAAGYTDNLNVGRYMRYMEDMMRVKNALGLCIIYTYQGLLFGDDMAKLYNASTGGDLSAGELAEHGERISNIAKIINVREGFTRKEDKVPEVWFRPMKSPEGTIEMQDYYQTKTLTKKDVDTLLDDYYEERGWGIDNGVPTPGKLRELGLESYSEDIQEIL